MNNGKLLLIAVAASLAVLARGATPVPPPEYDAAIKDFQKNVDITVTNAAKTAEGVPLDDAQKKDPSMLEERQKLMTDGKKGWFTTSVALLPGALAELKEKYEKAVKVVNGVQAKDEAVVKETLAKLNEIRDGAAKRVYALNYDADMIKFQTKVTGIVVGACGTPLDTLAPAPKDDMNVTGAGALLKDRRRLAIELLRPARLALEAQHDAAVSAVKEGDDANDKLKAEVTRQQMADALKAAMIDLDALLPAHPDVTEFHTAAVKILAKAKGDIEAAAPTTTGTDAAKPKGQSDKARPIVEAAQAELEKEYEKAVEACKDDAAAQDDEMNAVAAPSTTIAFSSAVAAVLVAAVAA